MAKIKKMADGGIAGLGSLLAGVNGNIPAYKDLPNKPSNPFSGSIGGVGSGGSASDGLGQINQGAGTVAGAISRASDALGGGGGGLNGAIGPSPNNDSTTYKKGGSAKKNSSGNSIISKISKVSTHEKNPKHKNCW
jgi:hypothetical protein